MGVGKLGHYVVIKKLGEGGMGQVLLAEDPRLKRQVALKVLPEALATDSSRLQRLQREAELIAALNHPNVVTLYSFEESDGIRFLTMELVEGESLDRLIVPGGLPLDQVFDMGIAMADALAAAHEKGIVHRDFKPANVMLDLQGRVKVLDFGLAKLVADTGQGPASELPTRDISLTGEGTVLGTVPYMSPEQIQGRELDHRTDIFSLGAVLYELSTGQRPFKGTNSAELISAILRDVPRPVNEMRGDVPRHLGRVVAHCMQKNPEQRVQTAKDVRNELVDLRKEVDSGSSLPAATSSVPNPASAPHSTPSGIQPTGGGRPLLWVLAGAAIIIVLLGVFWFGGFRGSTPGAGASSPAVDRADTPTETASLAVLPFKNLSADPEQEYFSDGLAEELMSVLAKTPELKVAGRTSSFSFKGKDETLRGIGEQLDVAHLLEGSVRKSSGRIRVSVQLVNAADGFQLWSETYDRALDDIFAVQDDIAGMVAEALRVTLLGSTTDVPDSRSTNVAAYNLYLKGRYLSQRQSREDWEEAVENYEAALALDQNYALAWAGLARILQLLGNWAWWPPDETVAEARAAVDRALEIDKNLVEGWVTLSSIRELNDWDWAGAEEAIRKARELDPRNPEVLRRLASQVGARRSLEQSIGLLRKTVELDPLNPSFHENLSDHLFAAGHLEEALAARKTTLELNPDRAMSHYFLGSIRLAMSQPEAALAEVQLEIDPCFRLVGLASTHHALGNMDEAQAALHELLETYAQGGAFQIAEVYSRWGEVDEAFEWLQRAYEQRDPGLVAVRISPTLVNLHNDPRWPDFLEKMGLAVIVQ